MVGKRLLNLIIEFTTCYCHFETSIRHGSDVLVHPCVQIPLLAGRERNDGSFDFLHGAHFDRVLSRH